MTGFAALVARDLRLALRQGSDAALVLIFYLLAVLLFPFGVGPEPNILARIAAGEALIDGLDNPRVIWRRQFNRALRFVFQNQLEDVLFDVSIEAGQSRITLEHRFRIAGNIDLHGLILLH